MLTDEELSTVLQECKDDYHGGSDVPSYAAQVIDALEELMLLRLNPHRRIELVPCSHGRESYRPGEGLMLWCSRCEAPVIQDALLRWFAVHWKS